MIYTLRQLLLIGIIVCVSFFMLACGKSDTENNGGKTSTKTPSNPVPVDFSKLSPDCFIESGTAAIITSGDFFVDSHWNDPHVIKNGSQFVMYASSPTLPQAGGDNDVGIYRLTSLNGLNWSQNPANSMIDRDSVTWADGWAEHAIETPAIVKFNGKYHMFFIGYKTLDDPTKYRIGDSISDDGITWNTNDRCLIGPTIITDTAQYCRFGNNNGVATDFDHFVVSEPGPVVFNNKIYLYYTAMGFHGDIDDNDGSPGSLIQSIGVISSSDGINWSTPQMAFRPDQTIYPRVVGGVNRWQGFSTPQPVVVDSKIVVFFDVVNETPEWNQDKISYAYSSDGTTNWTQATDAIFTKGDFTWAEEEMRSPSPYLDGSNLHLWFAGHSLTPAPFTLGIGHAKCSLAVD